MKRTDLVALVSGIVFALGLGIGGMTDPRKVIGFLDVAGAWDPSLAFVMAGAIAVHLVFARRAAKGGGAPLFGKTFVLPERRDIDKKLVIGAAIFGLGWGLGGFCPGPGIVATVSRSAGSLVFVGAMIAGMFLHVFLLEKRAHAPSVAVRVEVPEPEPRLSGPEPSEARVSAGG